MPAWSEFALFFAGLGLFLYGFRIVTMGLQKSVAGKLREMIRLITKNDFLGFLTGIAMTVILQGSNASNTLLIGFVNAGMIDLSRSLSVVLGSAVGTSLTIQLFSLDISSYADILLFLGAAGYVLGRTERARNTGQVALGLGLVYFGMNTMSLAASPLKTLPFVAHFFMSMGDLPLLAILGAILLTGILQNSAATLAMLISFASQGLLSSSAVIPVVLGAHVGGTLPALFSGVFSTSADARRAAIANTGYKVAAVAVTFPFLPRLSSLLEALIPSGRWQIADAHLFFSLVMASIFLPLTGAAGSGLRHLWPGQKGVGLLQYIDSGSLSVPGVALEQARLEIISMSRRLYQGMLADLVAALRSGDRRWRENVEIEETNMDIISSGVVRFLTALGVANLTEEQARQSVRLLYICNDLERVADRVREIAREFTGWVANLDDELWQDVEQLYRRILDNFLLFQQVLEKDDPNLLGELYAGHEEVVTLKRGIYERSLGRQEWYLSVTPPRGFSYLVLVESMVSIDGHTTGMAELMRSLPDLAAGRTIAVRTRQQDMHTLQWLDDLSGAAPQPALARVRKGLVELGERIRRDMLDAIPELCRNPDEKLIEKTLFVEDDVDSAYKELFTFLSRMLDQGLNDVQAKETAALLLISKELEYIGDAVTGVCQIAGKLKREDKAIPACCWEEMAGLYEEVTKNAQTAISALGADDVELAEKVIMKHPEILNLQQSIRFASCLTPQRGAADDDKKIIMYQYDIADFLLVIETHVVSIARALMGLD
jgi:phosphate:Na+ symporter